MPSYNFESQKVSARNLVLSPNSQLTPNEVILLADMTRRQRFRGESVMELKTTRRSDKDMSGKGTEFAVDGQVTSFDSAFTCKAELDDWLAGYLFAFAMGTDTVTGSAAPYTHAITFDEATTQAWMTNVYIEDTAAVKTSYVDMAMSELTVSYASRGAVGVDWSMAGTGHNTPGALASLPALASYAYLMNSDTVFALGASGSPASMIARFISGTLKINTGVINHTAPGGGLYGLFMRWGLRKFSFEGVIAAKPTDDILTLLLNDTLCGLTITTTSGALPSVLAVTIPNFKMKATVLATDGNMVTWKISLDETTAFAIVGGSPVPALSVSVQNSVAAYLVGV